MQNYRLRKGQTERKLFYKLSSSEQEGMSIVIANDSLLWVISPSVGTITRLKSGTIASVKFAHTNL